MLQNPTEIVAILLILANGGFTYRGLTDRTFMKKHQFEVDPILIGKDYQRLIYSGFLHVGWMHFAFNMWALYAFSFGVSQGFGLFNFLIIYFGSLLGGNLLALYIHRHHGDYSAVGASGAISGVLLAYIIKYPSAGVGIILLPSIPGWIFGALFILVSIFGIKGKWGRIGHEAHLGGAIVGMLLGIMMDPGILEHNLWVVALFIIPTAIFLYLVVTRPEFLLLPTKFKLKLPDLPPPANQRDDGSAKVIRMKGSPKKKFQSKQEELDSLLDKVQKGGIKKLSKKEKERLEILSKELE